MLRAVPSLTLNMLAVHWDLSTPKRMQSFELLFRFWMIWNYEKFSHKFIFCHFMWTQCIQSILDWTKTLAKNFNEKRKQNFKIRFKTKKNPMHSYQCILKNCIQFCAVYCAVYCKLYCEIYLYFMIRNWETSHTLVYIDIAKLTINTEWI